MINSVIYAIINIIDDKHYVGQTHDKIKRQGEHLKTLRTNKHCNRLLQRAYCKHGEANFIFMTLEKCHIEELTIKEQYWIDVLKPEYNLAPVAGSQFGYKHTEEAKLNMKNSHLGNKHSDETKAKMSASRMGNAYNIGRKQSKEHVESRAKHHRGKVTSEETKIKMSISQKGKTLTAEHKTKLSIAARNRVKREKSLLTFDKI